MNNQRRLQCWIYYHGSILQSLQEDATRLDYKAAEQDTISPEASLFAQQFGKQSKSVT